MMNRLVPAILLAALLPLHPAPLLSQTAEDRVLAEYEKVGGSVIRIRTIADLEYAHVNHRTGEARMATRPYSIDGSGVIVGRMEVDGNLEYLVLTNHHVADASNYVLAEGGYLRVNPSNTRAVPSVHEESYLMKEPTEEISEDDIQLIELVRLVRGDMTLMRTVGANRQLPVFEGRIGYRHGEVRAGDPIVTSGYPWGGTKIVAVGSIVQTDFPHALGIPHEDIIIDVPVEPGQSGGPIFRVEGDPARGEPIVFRLLGLVHAKDSDRSYGVPYLLWEDALDEFPAVLQERLVR
jgi:S1-C subfamily serine protease